MWLPLKFLKKFNYLGAFGEFASQERVSANLALKLSVVWACVNLRARIISSMPLNIKDNNKKNVIDLPLYRKLHISPNEFQTASEFWALASTMLDLYGNCYILVNKGKNEITSLKILLSPDVDFNKESNTYTYLRQDGKKSVYDYENVIHIKGLSIDGQVGLSPISYCANLIGLHLATERAVNEVFANSLKVPVILKTAFNNMKEDQRDRLRDKIEEFVNPDKGRKAIVLENGEEIIQSKLSISPVDAQLLDSRKWQTEEICRMFGVPPVLIGHVDKSSSWASSLELTNIHFLQYGLNPTLCAIEQNLIKKLLTPAEQLKYTIKFNRRSLLQADLNSQTNHNVQYLRNGVYSTNDVLDFEDLPASNEAGADKLRIEANMKYLDELGVGDEI